jgi:hypothetical protein
VTTTESTGVVANGHDDAGDQMLADLLDAAQRDMSLDSYAEARSLGATHAQMIEATDAGFISGPYCAIRMAGATHEEALEAYQTNFSLWHYTKARTLGLTHAEAFACRERTSGVYEFEEMLAMRKHGVTHAELLGYLDDPATALNYHLHPALSCLLRGASLADVLDNLHAGIDPYTLLQQLPT